MNTLETMNSWFKEAHLYRSKGISLKSQGESMVSHVHSVASNGCVNWSWPQEKMKRVEDRETGMIIEIFRFREKKGTLEDIAQGQVDLSEECGTSTNCCS